MPKKATVDSVQKHTEAKLQFYVRYLERYLRVLLNAHGIDKINIYDLYCGAGKYSDGNTGSAFRAVEAIWEAKEKFTNKTVNLHLNDLNARKMAKLRSLLENRSSSERNIFINFHNGEAFQLLEDLIPKLRRQNRNARNLIFIDPYGYKDISRSTIDAVMANGRTEIVLFLPVEQMYRFKDQAVDLEVESAYVPLKRFIEQFGLDVIAITSEKSFISNLEVALRLDGKYYTTSYSIKNHTGHHYGMFFITSNILGLEKIIEVKWDLDSQKGQGFDGNGQLDFFLQTERESDLYEKILTRVRGGGVDNRTLYEFVLVNGFTPTHGNKALRKLVQENKIYTLDYATGRSARKNTFKLHYKGHKAGEPSILFHQVTED